MDSVPPRFVVALACWLAAVLGCAAVTGGSRRPMWGRLAGLACLLAPLALPPSWGLARLVMTAMGLLAFGRSLDLTRRPAGLSFAARAWLMVSMFDLREATRVRPRFDRREALWLAPHLALLGACWWLVYALAPTLGPLPRAGLRGLAGLALIYSLAEVIQASQLLVYRALGVELPRINDYPILATTLTEFWGRRWNRVVSGWLSENLFMPLARRRRVGLGFAAAFTASAALHFWLAWVPLDIGAALSMASFFGIHGLATLLERHVGVRRWPTSLQRVWTLAWLILPAPLFIEPALRMLDGFNRAAALFSHAGS